MQNAALHARGLARRRLAERWRALPDAGFRGANVTIPHKQDAIRLADAASDAARAIGAVNTLLFEPTGTIVADNTDAPALIGALPLAPKGKTALVLGAGGSARAAVWALLDAGAAAVLVWNRHPERARALSEELGATPVGKATPADFL